VEWWASVSWVVSAWRLPQQGIVWCACLRTGHDRQGADRKASPERQALRRRRPALPGRSLAWPLVLALQAGCGQGVLDTLVAPPETDKQLYAAARVKHWTWYAQAPPTASVFTDEDIPVTAQGAEAGAWTFCEAGQSPWLVYWYAGRLESSSTAWIDATAAHEVGHVIWDSRCGCRPSGRAEQDASEAARQMLAGLPVETDCRE